MGVVEELVRARETYERGDWAAAFEAWSDTPPDTLEPDDLAGLATAAYLLGRMEVCVDARQRAFQLHLEAGDRAAAARSAFHLTMVFSTTGEPMVGAGWAARAQRLVEEIDDDVVERGYVEFLMMFRAIAESDWAGAAARAAVAVAHGRRFADPDLLALGLAGQGRSRLQGGEVPDGLALFDEAMVAVTSGEISPIIAGNVYCIMIEGCQEVSDLGRASAWTTALSRWCGAQPGLVAFTGQCAVHRGQIMRLHGAYPRAVEEFDGAVRRYLAEPTTAAAGLALSERGDVLRIVGDLDAAEASYDQAADHGYEPQPGLALLWLARGRTQAAVAAARRLLAEITDPVHRSRILPPAVEILLAGGESAEARLLAEELDGIANAFRCDGLQAMAAYAAGRVELECGDASGALPYLRKSSGLWHAMDCPYESARVRVQVALALRVLGDEESATSELEAARRTFHGLGTVPAAEEAARLLAPGALPDGLTAREAEVLRLVASGKSNTQIAAELVLSEKTVARHLSNIFTKLDVGSRTAAAAYAFEHQLA
ncbi:MAG: helix-turn-helix transcriptional regulator [Nocardioides sp.]|nr:helix-turn-helix transcriptional regulator [Nocardioides sp.]